MIPVKRNQIIEEAYDTSTFLLSNKLWFFRRTFTDDAAERSSPIGESSEFHAECRLWAYNLASNEIEIDDDFTGLYIDELDTDNEEGGMANPNNSNKHMKNIIFSEEFGQNQNETINQLLEKSLEAEEKKLD